MEMTNGAFSTSGNDIVGKIAAKMAEMFSHKEQEISSLKRAVNSLGDTPQPAKKIEVSTETVLREAKSVEVSLKQDEDIITRVEKVREQFRRELESVKGDNESIEAEIVSVKKEVKRFEGAAKRMAVDLSAEYDDKLNNFVSFFKEENIRLIKQLKAMDDELKSLKDAHFGEIDRKAKNPSVKAPELENVKKEFETKVKKLEEKIHKELSAAQEQKKPSKADDDMFRREIAVRNMISC